MKTLGRGLERTIIIEMTYEEYRALVSLNHVVNGGVFEYRVMDESYNLSEQFEDLTKSLQAISDYVEGQEIINQMQQHLDKMREKLSG